MRHQFARIAYVGALIGLGCATSIVACSGDDNNSAGSGSTVSTASGGAGGVGGAGVGGVGGAGVSVGGAGGAGGASTGSFTSGVGGTPTVVSPCQGHIYECGDLLDNDSDGLIDYQDPDCLGPCDNTEGSYYGGIPGQTGAACLVDCYFDQDSGSGNDGCYWNHQCDPHEVDPNYYPESNNGASCEYDTSVNTPGTSGSCDDLYMTQAQECLDFCGPLTPNGCDCFGCCELPAGGGEYVWLGSDANGDKTGSCAVADIDDPNKCQPCLPVAGCLNDCAPCELCIGKPTLPPECGGGGAGGYGSGGNGGDGGSGGGGQECYGAQQCGLPGQAACPAGYYCITGCCQAVPE
jgi:hypothetical protein